MAPFAPCAWQSLRFTCDQLKHKWWQKNPLPQETPKKKLALNLFSHFISIPNSILKSHYCFLSPKKTPQQTCRFPVQPTHDMNLELIPMPGGLALWPKPTASSRAWRKNGITDGCNESFSCDMVHWKKSSCHLMKLFASYMIYMIYIIFPYTSNIQHPNNNSHALFINVFLSKKRQRLGTRVHRSPLGAEEHVEGLGR